MFFELTTVENLLNLGITSHLESVQIRNNNIIQTYLLSSSNGHIILWDYARDSMALQDFPITGKWEVIIPDIYQININQEYGRLPKLRSLPDFDINLNARILEAGQRNMTLRSLEVPIEFRRIQRGITIPDVSPMDNLFKESYETLLKQLYGTERPLGQALYGPVQLPGSLIINGLKANFVPFEQISPSFWSLTKMRAFSEPY